jgi:hypothetical protein
MDTATAGAGMSTGEKVGIGAAMLAVISTVIYFITKKPSAAVAAPAAVTPAACAVNPTFSGVPSSGVGALGNMGQYALNAEDAQSASAILSAIESDPGFASWGTWWLSDLPMYMPNGTRDATFVKADIGNQKSLSNRIYTATNEIASEISGTTLNTTLFNLISQYKAKAKNGL